MSDIRFPVWPSFTEDEIAAVSRVLRSGRVNYWTGEETRAFEKNFAEWTGARYAIALANGTLALDLALRGLGIGPGDEVVVTPRSFIASVSCVVNAGAIPVFADVDRDSGNLTAETIAAALTPRTRAVIVVHLAGWPCDMQPITELAAARGLKVIEDCAQAHGARYRGRSIGTIGDVGAWSFCQDKIMTTGGEGGMVTTDDRNLWSRMWSFKDHGKSWEAVYEQDHGPGFRWLHESFGTNWRMTEMQAAIGNVSLAKVQDWVDRRQALASVLDDFFLSHEAFRTTVPDRDIRHAYYKYYVFLRPDRLSSGLDRDSLLAALHEKDVPAYAGICGEIYRESVFENAGFAPDKRRPVAQKLSETAIMIPIHPNITERDVLDIARAIAEQARVG